MMCTEKLDQLSFELFNGIPMEVDILFRPDDRTFLNQEMHYVSYLRFNGGEF